LNFIFGIVCLFVCVCAFSLHRESPDMILGDKPLIFEVVLSQSSSAASPNQDSSDNYPEIGISVCGDSSWEGRLISMVAPNGDSSHNSSSRCPTIGRSEASDARTPNDGMI
jgi:hypothetical protein